MLEAAPLLEPSRYVTLVLLMVEIVLVFMLVLGKTTKGAFAAASLFVTPLAMFFWLDTRVSEITIASFGTIKTAATLATQYVKDIEKIKSEVEGQKNAVAEEVAALKTSIGKARAETDEIRQRLADRQLTDEQVRNIADKCRPFANQEYNIITFWETKEPLAISNRIHQALADASWKNIPSPEFILGVMVGVQVWVHPQADQRVSEAATALLGALNDEHIGAELRQERGQGPKRNMISVNVGIKP